LIRPWFNEVTGEAVGERTRLVLVFPLDLKNVKEVCRGGVHLDQVLVGGRLGVGELGDFELMGALGGLVLESQYYPLHRFG
jgi:hypothetical protein